MGLVYIWDSIAGITKTGARVAAMRRRHEIVGDPVGELAHNIVRRGHEHKKICPVR
jgi:hypothetical protein